MFKGLKNIGKSLLVALVFVAGASYLQAAWNSPPSVSPPGNNVSVPINLGTVYQDKNGEIKADKIDVVNAICLNAGLAPGDCITSWPGGGGGPATCQLQTRRVDITTGGRTFASDPGVSSKQYPICDDYLSSEAKAAGWLATGLDNCVGTWSSDCQRPSSCVFTRMVCPSGITMATPTLSTSTYAGGQITIPLNSPTL